jgi:hypothetical protein
MTGMFSGTFGVSAVDPCSLSARESTILSWPLGFSRGKVTPGVDRERPGK